MRATVAMFAAAGLMALGCRSQMTPAAPSVSPLSTPAPPTRPTTAGLSGTWSGTGSDSFSAERVLWVLAQSDSTITGNVELAPVDPTDGSCASCHKLRKGTVTGTFDGSTLTIRMIFPTGGDVPTPICATELTATGSVTGDQLTGTYTGTDTCEGFYANGQLALTRPAPR
jgi:hypothetical protein